MAPCMTKAWPQPTMVGVKVEKVNIPMNARSEVLLCNLPLQFCCWCRGSLVVGVASSLIKHCHRTKIMAAVFQKFPYHRNIYMSLDWWERVSSRPTFVHNNLCMYIYNCMPTVWCTEVKFTSVIMVLYILQRCFVTKLWPCYIRILV